MSLRNPLRPAPPTPTVQFDGNDDPRRYGDFDEGNRLPDRGIPSIANLRDFALHQAGKDANAGIYVDPHLVGHGEALAAERTFAEVIGSAIGTMQGRATEDDSLNVHLIVTAEKDRDPLRLRLSEATAELAATTMERDHEVLVLSGKSDGQNGDDWSDNHQTAVARTSSVAEVDRSIRREKAKKAGFYAALALADAVAFYLIFSKTADFGLKSAGLTTAFAVLPVLLICTATVLLSHIIGVSVKKAQRGSSGRMVTMAFVTALLTLLLGIQVVMARLRAAAVLSDAQPIMLMWLFVCLAVSTAAAWYAHSHHNPHVRLLVAAHRHCLVMRDLITSLREKTARLEASLEQRRHSREAVAEQWLIEMRTMHAEYQTLVAIYRHELGRRLGDPSIQMALESAPVREIGQTGHATHLDGPSPAEARRLDVA